MLHRKPLKFSLYWWARLFFWIFSGLNVVAAGLAKLPVRPDYGALYAILQKFCESNAWWAVILATTGIAVTSWILKSVGSPETWDVLHDLLDGLQTTVFRGAEYSVPDEHKVTIFKAVGACSHDPAWRHVLAPVLPKKSRWLEPVVRSGHTSQDTKTCFEIFDDASKCLGVAGQAWARGQVVAVAGLPDVTGATTEPYSREIKAYAKDGFVTTQWVKEKKPKSRALLAIPILVRGEPWGVLVFDSRNPQKIRYDEVEEMFRVVSRHLNTLITKHL
jgi:hypothetical protein